MLWIRGRGGKQSLRLLRTEEKKRKKKAKLIFHLGLISPFIRTLIITDVPLDVFRPVFWEQLHSEWHHLNFCVLAATYVKTAPFKHITNIYTPLWVFPFFLLCFVLPSFFFCFAQFTVKRHRSRGATAARRLGFVSGEVSQHTHNTTARHQQRIRNLDSEKEISLFVHLTCIKWLWTYWALHI